MYNKKDKRKKYYFGGKAIPMQTTNEALRENQNFYDKAQYGAVTDPLVTSLGLTGSILSLLGRNSMSNIQSPNGGLSTFSKTGGGALDGILSSLSSLPFFAGLGGIVNNGVPVEAEGGEMLETPAGSVKQIVGPSHENGGVNLELPKGTEIFSNRIKISGITIADRKRKREKKEVKLEELIKKRKNDIFLSNSLDRTKDVNSQEENADHKIQAFVKQLLNPIQNNEEQQTTPDGRQMAFSGTNYLEDIPGFTGTKGLHNKMYPEYTNHNVEPFTPTGALANIAARIPQEENETLPVPTVANKETNGGRSSFKAGDALNMIGSVLSTVLPQNNTLAWRAGQEPYKNPYNNIGRNAISALGATKDAVELNRVNQKRDLDLTRNALIQRGRQSARGVNTMRALDGAATNQANNQERKNNASYLNNIRNINSQQAQLAMSLDTMKAQADEKGYFVSQNQRDNFFSQYSKNQADIGRLFTQIGGQMNLRESENMKLNLMSSFSQYFTLNNDGSVRDKNTGEQKSFLDAVKELTTFLFMKKQDA